MGEYIPKFLFDALEACKHVREFTKGVTFDQYKVNELLKSAVERKLEIIGEALNRIKHRDQSHLLKIREWRDIIAFRNKLAHCYDHINPTLVWSIVVDDLDSLIQDLEAALEEVG